MRKFRFFGLVILGVFLSGSLLGQKSKKENISKDELVLSIIEILNAPNAKEVQAKDSLPEEFFEIVENALRKSHGAKSKEGKDAYFEIDDKFSSQGRGMGGNYEHYRKLIFAYQVDDDLVVSYFHMNGAQRYNNLIVIKGINAKKRKNLEMYGLVMPRPSNNKDVLMQNLRNESNSILNYPIDEEDGFYVF